MAHAAQQAGKGGAVTGAGRPSPARRAVAAAPARRALGPRASAPQDDGAGRGGRWRGVHGGVTPGSGQGGHGEPARVAWNVWTEAGDAARPRRAGSGSLLGCAPRIPSLAAAGSPAGRRRPAGARGLWRVRLRGGGLALLPGSRRPAETGPDAKHSVTRRGGGRCLARDRTEAGLGRRVVGAPREGWASARRGEGAAPGRRAEGTERRGCGAGTRGRGWGCGACRKPGRGSRTRAPRPGWPMRAAPAGTL